MQGDNYRMNRKINKFRSKNIKPQKLGFIIRLKNEVFDFINQEQWYFQDQTMLEKVVILIEDMQESNIKYIMAVQKRNNIEKLLKSICIPSFPKLLHLNLIQCSITNIQTLSFIDSPFLKMIVLQRNRISYIKSIQKWFFPQLRYIKLSGNLIQQGQICSRIKLNLITQSNIRDINKYLKENNLLLRNLQQNVNSSIVNIYNFNTKVSLTNHFDIQKDKLLLDSLFIEDPKFYAKLQISYHLINHLQINDDQNSLRFDKNNRKLPCPFKKQSQNNYIMNQKRTKKGRLTYHMNTRQIMKKSLKKKEIPIITNKQQDKTIEIIDLEKLFLYLSWKQKIIIKRLLLNIHIKQIMSYEISDERVGITASAIGNTQNQDLNRKILRLKRIEQQKPLLVIRKKFRLDLSNS